MKTRISRRLHSGRGRIDIVEVQVELGFIAHDWVDHRLHLGSPFDPDEFNPVRMLSGNRLLRAVENVRRLGREKRAMPALGPDQEDGEENTIEPTTAEDDGWDLVRSIFAVDLALIVRRLSKAFFDQILPRTAPGRNGVAVLLGLATKARYPRELSRVLVTIPSGYTSSDAMAYEAFVLAWPAPLGFAPDTEDPSGTTRARFLRTRADLKNIAQALEIRNGDAE